MATAADEKAVLKAVAGRTEKPPNSNHIFVWNDLIRWGLAAAYFNGQPYCAGGVVWTNRKVKSPQLPVQSPYYCPSRVQYGRAHALFIPRPRPDQIDPGDEIFFGWTAAAQRMGFAEHVERVIAKPRGSTVQTFGFNTSGGTAGSQANGDGCFFRTRQLDATVIGVLKYSRLLGKPKAPVNRVKTNPYAAALRNAQLPLRQGAHGDAVKGLQWAAGIPVDGAFGPLTEHGLRVFQRFHVDRNGRGLVVDGEAGKLTVWALLQITHHQHS